MPGFETKTVQLSSGPWNVATAGTEGQGPILLLVHGFPLDHSMWQHQLTELSDSWQVIAPDLPGFGGSPAAAESFTMESMADGLADLLAEMKIDRPVVFCGLSMGGYVGWQFWRKHRARLSAFVGCDTRSAGDSAEVARGREIMAARVLSEGSGFVAEAMIPKLFAKDAGAESEPVKSTKQVINATAPASISAGQLAMAARVDATPWLGEIEVPALFVVGADDVITTPEEMRGLSAAVTGAEFFEIEQAGHMSPLEQPEVFNRRLREFLTRIES